MLIKSIHADILTTETILQSGMLQLVDASAISRYGVHDRVMAPNSVYFHTLYDSPMHNMLTILAERQCQSTKLFRGRPPRSDFDPEVGP